jgi:hypothetical protein
VTAHPNRNRARLAQYAAKLRTVDGRRVVEMIDPNDNTRARRQYRRADDGGLERRTILADGRSEPWVAYTAQEIIAMARQRGPYHPILDPLGCMDRAPVRGAQ